MIKNKKKILTRILATAFAVAFAILPLGLFSGEKNKVEASAEAFSETAFSGGSLDFGGAWLNPYSFFDFSIRRPESDWSGPYDDFNLDTYNFSLPAYVTSIDFLNDNGIYSTNSVFNYLPLYTGSVRMQFYEHLPMWYFSTESMPEPMTDYINSGSLSKTVHTFRMSIREKLVPLDALKCIFGNTQKYNFIQDQSNMYDLSLEFVYLSEVNNSLSVESFKYDAPGYHSVGGKGGVWRLSEVLSSSGVTVDNLSNYRYHETVRAVYVKNLDLQFIYVPGLDDSDLVLENFFAFEFHFPPTKYDVVNRNGYLAILDTYSDMVGSYEFVSTSPMNSIFSIVDEFFEMEVFPGFKISYLLYVSIAGLVIGFAIKIFLQG